VRYSRGDDYWAEEGMFLPEKVYKLRHLIGNSFDTYITSLNLNLLFYNLSIFLFKRKL
jgi:hypothetical protein